MIKTKKITILSKEYSKARKLMAAVFPKKEQTPMLFLMATLFIKQNHFFAIYEDDVFVGFVYYIEYDKYIGILYLAIVPEIQNAGYGGRIIDSFIDYFKKPLALNLKSSSGSLQESVKEEKLLSFYREHGIKQTGYYFQYGKQEYQVLSNETKEFDARAFEKMCLHSSYGIAHYKLYRREANLDKK